MKEDTSLLHRIVGILAGLIPAYAAMKFYGPLPGLVLAVIVQLAILILGRWAFFPVVNIILALTVIWIAVV